MVCCKCVRSIDVLRDFAACLQGESTLRQIPLDISEKSPASDSDIVDLTGRSPSPEGS